MYVSFCLFFQLLVDQYSEKEKRGTYKLQDLQQKDLFSL